VTWRLGSTNHCCRFLCPFSSQLNRVGSKKLIKQRVRRGDVFSPPELLSCDPHIKKNAPYAYSSVSPNHLPHFGCIRYTINLSILTLISYQESLDPQQDSLLTAAARQDVYYTLADERCASIVCPKPAPIAPPSQNIYTRKQRQPLKTGQHAAEWASTHPLKTEEKRRARRTCAKKTLHALQDTRTPSVLNLVHRTLSCRSKSDVNAISTDPERVCPNSCPPVLSAFVFALLRPPP